MQNKYANFQMVLVAVKPYQFGIFFLNPIPGINVISKTANHFFILFMRIIFRKTIAFEFHKYSYVLQVI